LQNAERKKLLRLVQQLTEATSRGKARCQPCAATARWTGVRLLD